MRKRWLARTLAGCLALSAGASVRAQDEPPGIAVVGAPRESDLPTELPPLIPPPPSSVPHRPPAKDSRPNKGPSDYDPAYNYLPDRNPGARQPPCPCLPLGCAWVIPSYFLGTTLNDSVPPLVAGTRNGRTGLLDGGGRVEHDFRSGMRLDAGTWLDRCHTLGVEGHFFFMESSLSDFNARSAGNLTVSRPFVLPDGSRDVQIVGGVAVTAPLQFLGAEANVLGNLFCEDNRRMDFIAGYRFVRLSEGVRIASASTDGGNGSLSQDQFRTENQFHGGQVGLTGEYRLDRWYVGATAKVAFGVNWERLDITGANRISGPAGVLVQPAGLLAQPSNIGRSRDAEFAVVPETNLTLGHRVTDYCRAFVGYTFLYISNVTRPGQAIDPVVNLAQLTPGAFVREMRPLRREVSTDFWMQGINLGVELRY